jgi:Predicted membrane protein
MSNFMKNLAVAAKGFAMGAANVIPGVSGGTIALLTGIFNELIESLNALLTAEAWKLLLKGRLKEFWEHIHGTFLLWLAVGVLVSVFSLAKLMEYVLQHYPVQTWAFFLGLILVSAVYMLADMRSWKLTDIAWIAAGVALGAAICLLSPSQTSNSLWFIALCGAIAICTMILPGISGSFILVLMGKYDFIMGAVSSLNIPVLLVFGLGCVVGIAAFSKFLHWLIARFEKSTLLVLIGFTLGALVKVWPWADMEACREANVLNGAPVDSLHVPSAVLWALIGAGSVVLLEWMSHRKKRSESRLKRVQAKKSCKLF